MWLCLLKNDLGAITAIDIFIAKMQRSHTMAILEKLVAVSCNCKLRAKCEVKIA